MYLIHNFTFTDFFLLLLFYVSSLKFIYFCCAFFTQFFSLGIFPSRKNTQHVRRRRERCEGKKILKFIMNKKTKRERVFGSSTTCDDLVLCLKSIWDLKFLFRYFMLSSPWDGFFSLSSFSLLFVAQLELRVVVQFSLSLSESRPLSRYMLTGGIYVSRARNSSCCRWVAEEFHPRQTHSS